MPEGEVMHIPDNQIITIEEIVSIVKTAVALGINKFRITGGEPLVRQDIATIVQAITRIPGIEDLGLTTNGIRLANQASTLYSAGLRRINISLDTLDADDYEYITRGGTLSKVIDGIFAAKKAGFNPIKINAVMPAPANQDRAQALRDFCTRHNLSLRLIRQMSLDKGEFAVVEGGTGGNCKICNRLRITADAKVKPCLFSRLEYDCRVLGIAQALQLAVDNKPETGTKNPGNYFYTIGG